MTAKKFRGSATKKDNGWHIEIDNEFNRELETMDPEDRKEIEGIMKGIRDGTIDPLSLGKRMCSYCGNHLGDVEDDIMMCRLCAEELK